MRILSHKLQRGYTLIELMIVVGVIGVLASIASGIYTEHLIKLQVMEGFVMTGPVRMEMMEYHNENGQWPNNNNMASLDKQNDLKGKYVKKIALNKHRVEIQYGGEAHKDISGKKIQLEPTVENGVINWGCKVTGGGVEKDYLPEMCR